jgi:polar amino acid transport system substrate-binding protein
MIVKAVRSLAALAALSLVWSAIPARADVAPPPKGKDAVVDKIRDRGVLKVAAIGEFPWLPENTTGSGEQYSGPAWVLAKEFARQLGVKLEVVQVSHETKVPILATGQADITIAPLSVTPARQKVVDFLVYSKSSLCLIGRADNKKLAGATSVDDLDRPDVTVAYFTGTPPETWLPTRFKNVKTRAVAGSGANAPVEEIMSGRADVTTIDNVAWPQLEKQVPGLTSWPKGDACLDSKEMAGPVGLAIDKGHPDFLAWITAVAEEIKDKTKAEEIRIMKGL